MTISRAILAFFLIGIIGQSLYYYPNLPEQMASHFNGRGEADNWMSKNGFFIFEFGILLLILAEFTLLPVLISKIPVSLINLPNKDYWLSEEKRAETFAKIRSYFEWFSIGLLGLFIAVNELVFRANLSKQNLSDSIWYVLIAFLLFVGIWMAKFILGFRKPL